SHGCLLDEDVDPALGGGAAIDDDGWRRLGIGLLHWGSVAAERRAALTRTAAVGLGERVLLEREFEVGLARIEPRLRQGPLQRALVALQQVERFGPLDRQPGVDLPALVHVELDIDAPQFRGVEPYLEAADALLHVPGDLERPLRQVDRRWRRVGGVYRPQHAVFGALRATRRNA